MLQLQTHCKIRKRKVQIKMAKSKSNSGYLKEDSRPEPNQPTTLLELPGRNSSKVVGLNYANKVVRQMCAHLFSQNVSLKLQVYHQTTMFMKIKRFGEEKYT